MRRGERTLQEDAVGRWVKARKLKRWYLKHSVKLAEAEISELKVSLHHNAAASYMIPLQWLTRSRN